METHADAILDHLTREAPAWGRTADVIHHPDGAGITRVERWPVGNAPTWDAPWVWRLMWLAARPGWTPLPSETGLRIAYGVAGSQEDATSESLSEAHRLAKERRAESRQTA